MSLGTRHDLIFSHEGNARAAASVILIGLLAALIGSIFMVVGPRFKQEPHPPRDANIGEESAPVRFIGHAPRENGSCDQQVWPNIDQRCLVRTEVTANSSNTSSPKQNEKLSPSIFTATTHGPSIVFARRHARQHAAVRDGADTARARRAQRHRAVRREGGSIQR